MFYNYHTMWQVGRQVKIRKILKIYSDTDLPHEMLVLPISRGERRILIRTSYCVSRMPELVSCRVR